MKTHIAPLNFPAFANTPLYRPVSIIQSINRPVALDDVGKSSKLDG